MKSIVKSVIVAMIITAFALTSTLAMAAQVQKTCPIMGGAIDKKLYADHNGKRVYFCCPGCEPQFKKNPKAFIKKLESQGVKLETVSK